MSQFTVSGKITAEAKAMVQATTEAAQALDKVTAAEREAAAAATTLNTETEKVTKTKKEQVKEERAAEAAIKERARAEKAALREVEDAARKASNMAMQQARMVTYTISDVVASLGSGASPMMILMQQGPQVAQSFDSPAQALKMLTSLMTPMRVAVGGVAAAVLLGVAAYESYAASVRQVDIALIAHGNRLGLTTQGYLDLASGMADAADVSESSGRTMVAAMVSAGVQSQATMQTISEAARGWAVVTSQDVAGAAADLAQKLRDPARAARELAAEFGLLDETQLRQIETMQRSGDTMTAQQLLAQTLRDRFSDAASQTSGWARAFEDLTTWASNAWDAAGKFLFGGPVDLGSQTDAQIAKLKLQIEDARGQMSADPTVDGLWSAEVEAMERELQVLEKLKQSLDEKRKTEAAAAAEAKLSTQLGALDIRYNPDQARLREIDANQVMFQKVLDDPAASAANKKLAQDALNGSLAQEAEICERIAKAGAPEKVKKTKEEIEAERELARQERERIKTQEDIADRMRDLLPPHDRAIAKARQWRDESLANLDKTKTGYAAFAADVETIFQGMLAEAYDEDLRRRTDWAAGIERGLKDLKADALDFAETSERGLRDMSRGAEDAFVQMAKSGKISFDNLADAFADMVLRMAYQKFLQPGIDGLLGDLVGFVGGLIGGGGSISSLPLPSLPLNIPTPVGVGHTGMMVGREGGWSRSAPMSLFAGAPRFHGGGLLHDEVPIIAQRGEGIFTPKQMDNASQLLGAAMQRPIVNVNLYGAPEGTRVEQREGQNGGLDIDVLMDQMEERFAGNITRGKSPMNGAIEQSYGLGREVF